MKKVSFTDMQKNRGVLPFGILLLGVVIVAVANGASHNSKAALIEAKTTKGQSQASESPAPIASPKITVNGVQVPADADGSTDISVGNGKAHVEVSGGHTQITTSNSGQRGDTSNQQSNQVQINLNSASSGSTNSGTTRVYDSSFSSNNGSSSFNSTHVFSTNSDHVSVSTQ